MRKKTRPLIIESPDLQTLRQRYAFALLTLAFWVLWFYLWIPLISLLAWLFGVELFYEHMVVLEGLRGLIELSGWYGLVILALGLTLGLWAVYNLLRFRGREKRRRPPDLTRREIAGFFGLSEADLDRAQRAKRLVIHHDDRGRIVAIDTTGLRRPGGPVIAAPHAARTRTVEA